QQVTSRWVIRWRSSPRLSRSTVAAASSGAWMSKARILSATLLMVGPSNMVNASLYDKLNFDFIRDIVPVASIMRVSNFLEVSPSVPTKTVPEFIAYAKTNSGKINMASSGSGSASHVSGELFKMMTGVNMLHVPYRGAALALTDLIGGQVQVMFDLTPNS